MIKILHIIPSLKKGGAERMVLEVVSSLMQYRDVEVRLVTFDSLNDFSVEYPEVVPDVVPAFLRPSVFGKWNININNLREYIEGFSPDIIHSHLFEAEWISRYVRYPKAVWYSHCHDNMIQFSNLNFFSFFSKKRLTDFYEKIILHRRYKANGGTTFIAISQDTYRYFNRVVPTYPVVLMPNAINCSKFELPRNRQKTAIPVKLLNIGSFVTKKNQKFLIKVAELLNRRNFPFELHFLGDGIEREQVMALSGSLIGQKKVFFHGNVDDVWHYLSNAHIYVHSAKYEPFGLVLLEAMAAGLPVISLDGKGNSDLVEVGRNGYLIEKEDAERFAGHIINLANNPGQYESMSSYAIGFSKKYDIKKYTTKLMQVYKGGIKDRIGFE